MWKALEAEEVNALQERVKQQINIKNLEFPRHRNQEQLDMMNKEFWKKQDEF